MSDPRFDMPRFLLDEIAIAANRTEIISILTRELARSHGVLTGILELSQAIPTGLLNSGEAGTVLRLVKGIEIGTRNLAARAPGRERPTN